MASSGGSVGSDVEDWLDVGDGASLPSLSLDEVLNESLEVENLEEGFSFSDDVADDSSLSLLGLSSTSSTSTTYTLDSAVLVNKYHSISHQIQSVREKSGTAKAIAEKQGKIAVVTSKGHAMLFDNEGRLDRFLQGEDWTGAASCVAFSLDGKHLAIGFSKGGIKIISVRTGTVHHVIREAVQPGLGVLQIQYLSGATSLLTLDNGGSVYEIRFKSNIFGKKEHKMRCVFSGCNGEVVHMKILPNSMLALLTVSKVLLVSTKFGGSVLGAFPLQYGYQHPPLFSYFVTSQKTASSAESRRTMGDFRIIVGRGDKLSIFRLHIANFGTKHKSATLHKTIQLPVAFTNVQWLSAHLIVGVDSQGGVWQIDAEKSVVTKAPIEDLQIVFATSDYKGHVNGGRVSEAMKCLAEFACYQSMTSSNERWIVLAHDGVQRIEKVTEWEQLERFRERGDEISAALYMLDIVLGRVRSSEAFRTQVSTILLENSARNLLELTMSGYKEGKVAQLIAHYKKYIRILLQVSISARLYRFVYDEVWPRLSQDVLSRSVLLESIDEYVLDGLLVDPPPTIVSDYLTHLATEGHFSQLQAAVVHFPIHSIDLHSIMSTCRQNGLYDGIIYVMNKALHDYISPLEEMLDALREFAPREVLADSEIDIGNRLLLYLHCCLAGKAYPFGNLPEEQARTVPHEVYRCLVSLKGKSGSATDENYPYLRLLMQFDAQQFMNVIYTCADAPIFQSDGRLQRITETVGLLAVALRREPPLVHFLVLVAQLLENSQIIPPIEIVQDSIISLLRLPHWLLSSTDQVVATTLRAVPDVNRQLVLRNAQSPMRPQTCGFIYHSERRFVDLVKCYLRDGNYTKNDIQLAFAEIDRIIRSADLNSKESKNFSTFVQSMLPELTKIDPAQCAGLIIDHYPDYLRNLAMNESERKEAFLVLKELMDIRRSKGQATIIGNDDLDENLFGTVFTGICQEWNKILLPKTEETSDEEEKSDDEAVIEEKDAILSDLLSFWLPIGSRKDVCLNEAAKSQCVHAMVMLLEARGLEERAFEVLYKKLQTYCGVDEEATLHWLDEALKLCTRRSSSPHASNWMLQVFRFVAQSAASKDATTIELSSRLNVLVRRILATGTEHAAQLVDSLLECPSFTNSTYVENYSLINEILAACDYEKHTFNDVLEVINTECSDKVFAMSQQLVRRCSLTASAECVKCGGTLNQASFIFRCGHMVHMECCEGGEKKCLCEKGKLGHISRSDAGNVRTKNVRKKDIFAGWDQPLSLIPSPGRPD